MVNCDWGVSSSVVVTLEKPCNQEEPDCPTPPPTPVGAISFQNAITHRIIGVFVNPPPIL